MDLNTRRSFSLLIVDDNPADVETVERYLSRNDIPRNLSFDSAGTSEDALSSLTMNDYDLILLDYQLADHDAFDLLETFYKENLKIPVVMLTGEGNEEVASRAIKYDIVIDYIPKEHLNSDMLQTSIENALVGSRLKNGSDTKSSSELTSQSRDPETKLFNRKRMEHKLVNGLITDSSLSVLFIRMRGYEKAIKLVGLNHVRAELHKIAVILQSSTSEDLNVYRVGSFIFAINLAERNATEFDSKKVSDEIMRDLIRKADVWITDGFVTVRCSFVGLLVVSERWSGSARDFIDSAIEDIYKLESNDIGEVRHVEMRA